MGKPTLIEFEWEATDEKSASIQLESFRGGSITRYNIGPDKHCPYCGVEIPIIGEAIFQTIKAR